MPTRTRKQVQPSTDAVEALRVETARQIDTRQKAQLGQFFTVMPVARLMAAMIECEAKTVRILDAGAGVGSLFTAAIAQLCRRRRKPKAIHVTACEIDAGLQAQLKVALQACEREAAAARI